MIEESKSQLWANGMKIVTIHCRGRSFIYVQIQMNGINIKKWCIVLPAGGDVWGGIWLIPGIWSVLWSNNRALAGALRNTQCTFFCISSSPMGSHLEPLLGCDWHPVCLTGKATDFWGHDECCNICIELSGIQTAEAANVSSGGNQSSWANKQRCEFCIVEITCSEGKLNQRVFRNHQHACLNRHQVEEQWGLWEEIDLVIGCLSHQLEPLCWGTVDEQDSLRQALLPWHWEEKWVQDLHSMDMQRQLNRWETSVWS